MELTIAQAIEQAIAAHRGGRLAEAEHLYRAILQAQPTHGDANHNLAVLLSAGGKPDLAIPLFKRALEAHAGNGQYWLSLAEALADARRTEEAQQVLAAGRQRGLAGDRVDRLASRLVEAAPPMVPASQGLDVLDEAVLMRENGAFAEAEAWLRGRLVDHPAHAEALSLLAHVLLLQKKDHDAHAVLAQAFAIAPSSPSVLRNVARVHLKNGKTAEALQAAAAARQLAPNDEESWLVMAAALAANDDRVSALGLLEQVLARRPRYAEAFANRAILRMRSKDHRGAASDAEQAAAIKPHWGAAWALLATARQELGDLEGTIAALRQAAEREPQNVVHLVNLGEFQRQAKRPDEAIATLERAVTSAPDNVNAWINYGTVLQEVERIDDAIAAYEKALQLNPKSFAVTNNLGALAMREKAWEKACRYFSHAIGLNPQSADSYANLGSALTQLRRLNESLEAFRRAIDLDPRSPEAHAALGRALIDIGRPSEGEASYRAALALDPGRTITRSNLLFSIAYRGATSPGQYLEDARSWEQAVRLPGLANAPAPFAMRPRHGRRLRVGYVSGDFRQHAVSTFIEPVFRNHDRDRVEVVAYSSYPFRDEVTDRLRGLVPEWRSLVGHNTQAARQRIIADKIDVLIDLAGHTSNNRLDVFAHRAAPVQAHYLGYFASTGLSEMDYWIGDTIVLPPEEEPCFAEKLWRLPRPWVCYQGSESAPATQWCPTADGSIRFGSFNNLNKMTPATIALWARVLHSMPQSTLLLKTAELDDSTNIERIATAFQGHGIASDRLDLRGRTASWEEHMRQYDQIDVALDPVGGVGGGTTTCDALWMGVPVVTLVGQRMAGRMTASMLRGIGRPEWIAGTADEYVDLAVALARDVDARRVARVAQRAAMRASPLCAAADLAGALEAAYAEMFDRWHDEHAAGGSATRASRGVATGAQSC